VAVKILSDALASEPRFAQRFRREALAAAGLSHPAVASVYDYGENGGPPFIVMELVDGETLSDRIRREGRLPPEEGVRIATSVAAALQAAHDAGLVHRDVKPGNIMLTTSGEVRVLDFGIAAAAGAPLTTTGAVLGTATYLSPEQARGEPVTPVSDVYSLGVTLYEMLTGRPPFVAEHPVGIAAQHLDQPPPPVRDVAPEVPSQIADATEAALAKDPAARPASAAAFAAMLAGRVAPPTAVRAGPESTMVLPPREPTAVLPAARRPSPAGKPGSHRGWLVLPVLLAIGLVGLLVFLATSGNPAPAPSQRAPAQAVPDVTGLTITQAEDAIQAQGLQVGDVVGHDDEHSVVTRTDPPAGSLLQPGSTVTLYVGPPPKEHGKEKGKSQGGGGGD
jgi:serine/threonine-protein kinase